jgi:hypothetical protein
MDDEDDEIIPEPLQRLPGLFRLWEITALLRPGEDYRLEDAGSTSDGSPLFAVYRSTGVNLEAAS